MKLLCASRCGLTHWAQTHAQAYARAVRKLLIWPDTDEGILVLGQNTPRYSNIAMLYSLPC